MDVAPRVTRRLLLLGCALTVLLVGCTGGPSVYHEPAPLASTERTARNLAVFDAAWALVNDKYYDPRALGTEWAAQKAKYRPDAAAAPDGDTLYLVINRMAAELRDHHVYAISPRRVHAGRSGYEASTGLHVRRIDDRQVVSAVIPGSSAEAAGIRPGWILVSPDTLAPDSPLIRSGGPISCRLLDEHDQPRTLSLNAPLAPLGSSRTDSRALAGSVRYLRFDHFNPDSVSWLSRELKAHRDAPAVIVDLRENVGGNSVPLQEAAREFFAEGRSLGQTISRNGRTRRLDTLAVFPARYPGRVVILTGGTTASSAEIFTHALQYYRRATVVGRPTSGVVEAGFKHPLPDGGYMNVSEQDYRGLDGRRLEGIGVQPDRNVPAPSLAELRAGIDRDLEEALRLLQENERGPARSSA